MNFPHPRRHAGTELRKVDYFSLVASATSRQATSRTVSAMLAAPRERVGEVDSLASRIAFFAQRDRSGPTRVHGAFWPVENDDSVPTEKLESAVNASGSMNSNPDRIDAVKPEMQVAERGTEF